MTFLKQSLRCVRFFSLTTGRLKPADARLAAMRMRESLTVSHLDLVLSCPLGCQRVERERSREDERCERPFWLTRTHSCACPCPRHR